MLNDTPTARLVHTLTDADWNKATRNAAARQISLLRGGSPADDPVVQHREPILQHGVVGRYDRSRAELLRVIAEASGCAAVVDSEQFIYQGKRRKYSVRVFGHRSDVDRTVQLYADLMTVALAHMLEITGEGVMPRRREWFNEFIAVVSKRLQDVGEAPGLRGWIAQHHEDAYEARDDAEPERHRELAYSPHHAGE